MEQKKAYFSLGEMAEIFGQSVEAIKDKVFEGHFLTPSYLIKKPIRSGFYTELQTKTDKENDDFGTTFPFVFGFRNLRMIPKRIKQPLSPCVNTIEKSLIFDSINTRRRRHQNPFNASFTGIVDIVGIHDHRHSGEFDGKIQLHPNFGRRSASHSRLFRLRLIYLTQSGLRVELDILEPREISEDKFIVRREYLLNAIANDDEAMEHFEQLERLHGELEVAKEKTIDQSTETPEKFASSRRDEGIRKEIIAYELKLKYGYELQWHEVARLVDPNKKYTEEQEKAGNPRKTGQRWAKMGKSLKEMTSS